MGLVLLLADCLLICVVRHYLAPRLRVDGPKRWLGALVPRAETQSGAQLIIFIACVAATYSTTAALFTASLLLEGETYYTACVQVVEDRPAARAGMQNGDMVISVGGRPVVEYPDISRALNATTDTNIELRIRRNGKEQTVVVTPEAAEEGARHIGVAVDIECAPAAREVGLFMATGRGLAQPVASMRRMVDLFRHGAMVKPRLRAPTFTQLLRPFAEIKTLMWPLALVFAGFLVMRRDRTAITTKPKA